VLILVTVILAAGAACLIWRDLLMPKLSPLPPAPTLRQRQFGMRMTPALAKALDRPLPESLTTGKDLATTLVALRDATKVKFVVNWRALELLDVKRNTPVPPRQLGGIPFGDALRDLLASVHGSLVCRAEDDPWADLAAEILRGGTVPGGPSRPRGAHGERYHHYDSRRPTRGPGRARLRRPRPAAARTGNENCGPGCADRIRRAFGPMGERRLPERAE
jgi:hypothetical protein